MENNSATAYAFLKIKMDVFYIGLIFLGLLVSSFLLKETIIHPCWIETGSIEVSSPGFICAIFYTLMVFLILILLGLLAILVYLFINYLKCVRIIKYYRVPRFVFMDQVTPEFDYKLWQTAPKNSFHALSFDISFDGKKKSVKTGIHFTNNEKIGIFKVPEILLSKSYVKNDCVIGYNMELDEIVVLSIVEK